MAQIQPSALANSVMGKLYDVLTNGDETVPQSEDNFFSWCTPGIPVDATDFEFLEQGLTGVVKKRQLDEMQPTGQPDNPSPEPVDPSLLEALRAQDANRMYMQAESLARLVDFVPDLAKDTNEQFSRLTVMNNEGTLSDVYEMTLRMSQVMHQELPEETKAKIERFRGLLNTTKVKKNLIDDTEIEVSEPSPLVVAYNEKLQAYMSAALEYNARRIDALTAENQRAVHDWAMNANIYRQKVKAAMKDWQTNGYKSDYETIAAFIEQVQARDMALLKEDYKDALQKAQLTGISSGSDFYYTSLAPGGFADSGGWTRFTFSSGDLKSHAASSTRSSRWKASGGASYMGFFGGRASRESTSSHSEFHGTFESNNFGLSFEICQVPIVRPWFKTAFLASKAWRFDPSSPDLRQRLLSDGDTPANGMLPAYPTTAVFIRDLDLKIGHSQSFRDFVSDHKSSSTSGGGFLSFGPIFLGGSAGHSSSSGSTTRDWGMSYDNQGMQVRGMQIIGFKCHVLPRSPDPDPSITDWI